jgi:hypothetical protein
MFYPIDADCFAGWQNNFLNCLLIVAVVVGVEVDVGVDVDVD